MIRCPRVSVVMASYNHAEFVGAAIESVLTQSFSDFEFIITDDGSTDGTAEVIRSFRDDRINIEVFQENIGACEATNRCIARARGEYVAVINSDDLFLPGKLERQIDFLDTDSRVGAVFGLANFIDERGGILEKGDHAFGEPFVAAYADGIGWLRHLFVLGNGLCHPSVMIRSTLYQQLGGYDASLRQLPDYDMWIRVCGVTEIVALDEPLIAFRVLENKRNTSAITDATVRRTSWEYSRCLLRYVDIADARLTQAFESVLPPSIARREAPMWVKLALYATELETPWHALFALEVLRRAVVENVPGLTSKQFHEISGRLNPMRCGDPTREEMDGANRRLAEKKAELRALRARFRWLKFMFPKARPA